MKGSRHQVHPRMLVEIFVRQKPQVPDPEKADKLIRIQDNGYDAITGLSSAKYFRIVLVNVTRRKARAVANASGMKLLVNPVIEYYEIYKIGPI